MTAAIERQCPTLCGAIEHGLHSKQKKGDFSVLSETQYEHIRLTDSDISLKAMACQVIFELRIKDGCHDEVVRSIELFGKEVLQPLL